MGRKDSPMTHNGDSPRTLPDGLGTRVRRALVGPGRDLRDPSLGHKISLVALLAWVGLGADGLSSSSYGPEEAYRVLAGHSHVALAVAFATAATVFIIAFAYRRIIERFPAGGGGYLVATQLLGPTAGTVSGAALLIDYVLTITVSIAAGGDAVFSLLPASWLPCKTSVEFGAIFLLTVLNLRGVKESVTALVPIFLVFVVTHVVLIGGGIIAHLADLPAVARTVQDGYSRDAAQLGLWGLLVIFLRSYSMGAGTYTGLEAVSNGLGILREPRMETGRRTMLYMAVSLAVTAGGILVCYMLVNVSPEPGRTLNAILAGSLAGDIRLGGLPIGHAFVMVTIASEAVLLLVAAQAGFIDGPRVMSNMAMDSWLPRRFAAISDRLTMQNGILLMGVAAMVTLYFTKGRIGILVVMYSINVFVTFSLSQLGMIRSCVTHERGRPMWLRHLLIHGIGFVLCFAILCIMLVEKLTEGGWVTLVITAGLILLCFAIRRHYANVGRAIREVDRTFANLPGLVTPPPATPAFDASGSTAVLLVGSYGGLGVHMLLSVFRLFPACFQNVYFLSVAAVDSSFFRGGDAVEGQRLRTQRMLDRYMDLARRMGKPARCAFRIGTDVVDEAAELSVQVAQECSKPVFFAGTLVFDRPHWYHRILHNETAYAIQRRLRFAALPMVILPLLLRSPQKGGHH